MTPGAPREHRKYDIDALKKLRFLVKKRAATISVVLGPAILLCALCFIINYVILHFLIVTVLSAVLGLLFTAALVLYLIYSIVKLRLIDGMISEEVNAAVARENLRRFGRRKNSNKNHGGTK